MLLFISLYIYSSHPQITIFSSFLSGFTPLTITYPPTFSYYNIILCQHLLLFPPLLIVLLSNYNFLYIHFFPLFLIFPLSLKYLCYFYPHLLLFRQLILPLSHITIFTFLSTFTPLPTTFYPPTLISYLFFSNLLLFLLLLIYNHLFYSLYSFLSFCFIAEIKWW